MAFIPPLGLSKEEQIERELAPFGVRSKQEQDKKCTE
jgi:hypothetical protein